MVIFKYTLTIDLQAYLNILNLTYVIQNYVYCQLYVKDLETIPQAVVEMEQSTGDPTEGIETSPSAMEKPQVLCIHDQHATDYVRLMMEEGVNLPMGEPRAAPLITEV